MLNGGDRGAGPSPGNAGGVLYEDEIDPTFLQRSISAPPATDHAFPGQGPDRLGLDYYYYYQPNSLNPRLPKTVPPAPGLGAPSTANKGPTAQDDSGLFTHFPQPSKPQPVSSTVVGDYLSGLQDGTGASGGTGSPLGLEGPSQPQTRPPQRPPSAGPGPIDPPMRPAPIGSSLSQDKSLSQHTKSLIELIQEDFPRTPSPVFAGQISATTAQNIAHAISLGQSMAQGTGPSPAKVPSPPRMHASTSYSALSSSSAAGKVPSPPRIHSSASYSGLSSSGAGPGARSSSTGPGLARPSSHGHIDMLASGVQTLSLAAPADELVLGPGEPAPEQLQSSHSHGGPRGGPMPGHQDVHGLDHHSHLPPRHQPGRVMYQHDAGGPMNHVPNMDPYGPQPGGPGGPPGPVPGPYGHQGAPPMYAAQPEQVYFRVAQGGGPYRQDLVYRVPQDHVPNGDYLRHGPVNGRMGPPPPPGPEYLSVMPMGAGGGGPQVRHARDDGYMSYGVPGQQPRLIPAHYAARDMHGHHRLAAPAAAYGPQYAAQPLTPHEMIAYGRLQAEAHANGFKLVPKDNREERKQERRHRDRDRMLSSSTLEEFRNNTKNRPWDIRDIAGDIVEFCQDQHGSRFIQQKLEVATDEEKDLIFKEILPRAHTLMTDVFGNYVIQKVLEHGTPDHRDTIASILTGHAVQLALQMYGCRVIQKALEVIGVQRLLALVSEFEGHVLKCVHDQNGNHVIQKCIEVLSLRAKELPEYASFVLPQIEFIVQAFVGQVEKFSTHPYGCRVIQRILEHCTGVQKNVSPTVDRQITVVLDEIRKCTSTLIQDQYGNYVVQHVMKHGRPADRQVVVNEVKARMLLYSQHKFASNVVEKCLQYGSKLERNEIIEEVVRSVIEKSSLLQVMVRDPYGNYVVQKILDIADDRQQETLCQYLKQHAAQLKRYTYGKHILVRLEKISGEKLV